MVVLNITPFYAEMGGQIGDIGLLKGDHLLFTVKDCIAPYKGVIAHVGTLEKGTLKVGMNLFAEVDKARRQKIANNHTATHLLHWALHKVLGEHVKQAGSVVDPYRLRFDFNHHKALSQEELHQIEDLVNEKIRDNHPVSWYEIPYEEAQKRSDIKQFFGEKYGAQVRVVDVNFSEKDSSKELCGGTHTTATGTIGFFRIAKESSIAAGVRRIEALSGVEAEALIRKNDELINSCAISLKTQPQLLLERIEKLLEEHKELSHELKLARKSQLEGMLASLINQVETVHGIPVLATALDLSPEELRSCADDLMKKLPSLVLILASNEKNKCGILARVSDDLIQKGLKANEIIKALAPIIEGSGGGKPNSAQAGGTAPHKIQEALTKAKDFISNF
jgi:alanyl-tRNA synthetase